MSFYQQWNGFKSHRAILCLLCDLFPLPAKFLTWVLFLQQMAWKDFLPTYFCCACVGFHIKCVPWPIELDCSVCVVTSLQTTDTWNVFRCNSPANVQHIVVLYPRPFNLTLNIRNNLKIYLQYINPEVGCRWCIFNCSTHLAVLQRYRIIND